MKKIHSREKAQFKKLLTDARIDHVEDRFRVMEAFLTTEQHVTAEDLFSLLHENGISLPLTFIKETLKLMVRYGFAEEKRFADTEILYEHRHMGLHHDHMICTKCRKIIEFEDEDMERLQARIASNHGFHILLHKMEIYGICAACQKDQTVQILLAEAKPGERLIVKAYEGGKKQQMRLINMGLRIGDEIEVITNSGHGQVVVASGFSRFVLGQKMALNIRVEQKEAK